MILFFGVLLAVFQLSGLRQNLNLMFVHDQFLQHPVVGLLTFVALFSLGNLIFIPGWVFLAAAVLALGRTMGGLATYVAAVTSCMVTFIIIRALGGDALRQIGNVTAKKILARLDAHPFQSVVLLRILFQTVPALDVALALSGVRSRHYLWGTLLGLPLPIFLYCLFFDYVRMLLGIH